MPTNPITPAKDRLKSPKIQGVNQTKPQILAAREKLRQICSELPTALAKNQILHCEAPTGTGKTLSCAHLAARIALDENLEHILYVNPYILLVDQAEKALRDQIQNEAEIVAVHSRKHFSTKAKAKTARKLGATINICTAARLHDCLLEHKMQKAAKTNLEKSVIIIDDAALYLRPRIAAATLVLLDTLRKAGARILLVSATLPHYDEIEGCLPDFIKIHRFGKEICEMPGIVDRCKLQVHTRPLTLDSLPKILKNQKNPTMLICETVKKSNYLFQTLQREFPNHECFLINANQWPYKKKQVINLIEEKLKTEDKSKVIVISTSVTQAGWDVSFSSGGNDIFDVIGVLEQKGRINRAMEFGKSSILHLYTLDIPGVHRNPQVDTTRRIAQEMIENSQIYLPNAPTIAAQKELLDKDGSLLRDSKKSVIAAKKKDMAYLQKSIQLMPYTKKGQAVIPPRNQVPVLFKKLKDFYSKMGYKAQMFKGNIELDEFITEEEAQKILKNTREIYEEFSFEINPAIFQELQGQGDVFTRIMIKTKGKIIETDHYMLSPKAFSSITNLL